MSLSALSSIPISSISTPSWTINVFSMAIRPRSRIITSSVYDARGMMMVGDVRMTSSFILGSASRAGPEAGGGADALREAEGRGDPGSPASELGGEGTTPESMTAGAPLGPSVPWTMTLAGSTPTARATASASCWTSSIRATVIEFQVSKSVINRER